MSPAFRSQSRPALSDSLQDWVAQNVATKEQLVMFNRRGKLMKPFRIPALCLISVLAIAAPRVDAQTNALVGQTSPPAPRRAGYVAVPQIFEQLTPTPAEGMLR